MPYLARTTHHRPLGFADLLLLKVATRRRWKNSSGRAQIQRRLDLFCSLPMDKMEWLKLEHAVKDIGRTE